MPSGASHSLTNEVPTSGPGTKSPLPFSHLLLLHLHRPWAPQLDDSSQQTLSLVGFKPSFQAHFNFTSFMKAPFTIQPEVTGSGLQVEQQVNCVLNLSL